MNWKQLFEKSDDGESRTVGRDWTLDLTTPQFGPLALGASTEDVVAALGEPDENDADGDPESPSFFSYEYLGLSLEFDDGRLSDISFAWDEEDEDDEEDTAPLDVSADGAPAHVASGPTVTLPDGQRLPFPQLRLSHLVQAFGTPNDEDSDDLKQCDTDDGCTLFWDRGDFVLHVDAYAGDMIDALSVFYEVDDEEDEED